MASQRYLEARAAGNIDQVLEADRELLREFGLRLLSVDSGVQVVVEREVRGKQVHPWHVTAIPDKAWSILHPLLAELRELRAKQK